MHSKIKKTLKGINPLKIGILSDYRNIIISFALSAGVFYLVSFLEDIVYHVYIQNHYLIIHTIIEFASIIMYIASFLVIFYVGERDRRLRMKVLAGVLLFVGAIDFWHTFSYDGMPGLIVDSSKQSATLYWIIGRLGFAGGILISSFIPIRIKIKNTKTWAIAGIPLFLSLFILFYVSYFPDNFPLLFKEGYGPVSYTHLDVYKRQSIKPVEFDKTKGIIKLAYFEQKSTVDYMGNVQGIPICFDAKETTRKSLPISNIHPHQIEFMENFTKQEGIAFIIAYFQVIDEYYFIPFEDLKIFWERAKKGGRKSISFKECNPEFIIPNNKGVFIHYLETLNKYLVLKRDRREQSI